MGYFLRISIPARHDDCNVGAAIVAASGSNSQKSASYPIYFVQCMTMQMSFENFVFVFFFTNTTLPRPHCCCNRGGGGGWRGGEGCDRRPSYTSG